MAMSTKLPPLLVRADADGQRGIGHVMRCAALAQAWRSRGGAVTVLSCAPRAVLDDSFAAAAVVLAIGSPHPNSNDLAMMLDTIRRQRDGAAPPWLALDGYHFDLAYQRAVRAAGCRLLVIDDTAHLPDYDADMILNHGAHAPALDYPCPAGTRLLRGPAYALLRSEFQRQGGRKKFIAQRARRLLVTMGGSDPVNATAKIIEALQHFDPANLTVRVVVGPANGRAEELRRQAAAAGPRILLEIGRQHLAPLMRWADLALSAAGGTCAELAAMGVPMALLALADNQRPIAAALEAAGVAVNLGWHDSISSAQIAASLSALADDFSRRSAMSAKARALVDGRGAERVVAAMLERTGARAA